MKEIKLTIDGKEVQLTAEQIKALGIDVDDGCVCDRVEEGEVYYIVSDNCKAELLDDDYSSVYNGLFNCGNYYRSESYAKQVAMHQHLNNLLRRYSEQHGGDCEWSGDRPHYGICLDARGDEIKVFSYSMVKGCGVVYFKSRDIAEKAIEEVVKPFMSEHPDFVW